MKIANFKTILIPIDFSGRSQSAIELAKRMASRFEGVIHLVHVHEFPYLIGPLAPIPLSVLAYGEDVAARRARHLRMLAKRNGLAAENCHFLTGAPTFGEISRLARELAADLIVMPTRGRTGAARFFGGSTAERIVQHAPCPVLVTREARRTAAREQRRIDTILVPVDFSPPSLVALECAIAFAEKMAARLILFHAVPLGDAFTADGFAMYDLSVLEEEARQEAEQQMQKFVRRAKFRGVHFETVVRIARAAEGICALAKERKVDLIITATHGRTGFRHLLIGSVAELVVRQAGCPVLVVPSHPDIREARLGTGKRSTGRPRPRKTRVSLLRPSLTRKSRKLAAHPAPERRQTNRFRESHAFTKESVE
jgi:nucleotide-binding universal stress UspA family protein